MTRKKPIFIFDEIAAKKAQRKAAKKQDDIYRVATLFKSAKIIIQYVKFLNITIRNSTQIFHTGKFTVKSIFYKYEMLQRN